MNRDLFDVNGGLNLYMFGRNLLLSMCDILGLWSPTSESRCDERRVYEKSSNCDTIKSLANMIGMDEETCSAWARIENSPMASSGNGCRASSGISDLNDVRYISVPNVWIEADLLHGGGLYDTILVNQGGTIGSFLGQTLGRWGYHTIKPETPGDLLKAINDNQGNIYGLTVYAHGSPNGYIVSPTKKAIHQDELMSSLHSNGYRIAEANMMQCYSINPNGTMVDETGTEQPFNYKAAWEKTAVKVFGYEGINVFGIDF